MRLLARARTLMVGIVVAIVLLRLALWALAPFLPLAVVGLVLLALFAHIVFRR
ncbi:MAG: hypothetical protein ACJ74O_17760 [Frankiaceae bacterium]